MDTLTKEMLDYLVKRYQEATGSTMVYDTTMNSEQGRYYFKLLEDNLIEPMSDDNVKQYKNGDGNELEEKMRAIRSSSALTYNLFGNNHIAMKVENSFFVPGLYEVVYEKQLKTIKRSPRKANLDAFLESEDSLIFFEMKMTEWLFNKPGTISDNYLDKGHYFDEESYEAFRHLIKGITNDSTTDYKAHYSSLKQYDGVQMFKHLLGVYNYLMMEDQYKHKNVRLVNCVWELPDSKVLSEGCKKVYDDKYALEKKEFEEFYQAAQPVIKLLQMKNIDFDILLVSVKDTIDSMDKTEPQRKFLDRYL